MIIKKQIMQAVDLCFEINAETEHGVTIGVYHNFVLIDIRVTKALCADSIFKSTQFFIGDMADLPALEKDLKEFTTIGLDLIKQENPATYSRIKKRL